MLMYALLGAIVFGGVMFVAHQKVKQGIQWGTPLEIVSGLLAIAFAVWAMLENIMGVPESQRIAERWQAVRGTGAAAWVQEKCSGKKLLVIKSYSVEGQKDPQYEAFSKGLEGMTYEVFELPKPKEMSEGDMMSESMMYIDGPVSPAMKKEMKKQSDEMEAAISSKVSPDKYDTVVFFTSLPEFMIYPKPVGQIKSLQKKNFVFLYSLDAQKSMMINKNVIGSLTDKALANPDDYDKAPTGNQATDFSTRYEFKAGAAK